MKKHQKFSKKMNPGFYKQGLSVAYLSTRQDQSIILEPGARIPEPRAYAGKSILQMPQVVWTGGLEGPWPSFLASSLSTFCSQCPSSVLSHTHSPENCCILTNEANTSRPHLLGLRQAGGLTSPPEASQDTALLGCSPRAAGAPGSGSAESLSDAPVTGSRHPMTVEDPPRRGCCWPPTHSHMASQE